MEKQYNCKVYYPIKGLVYSLLIVSFFIAILIFISRLLDNAGIGVVGFILLLIVPFYYQQKVKNFFTKEVVLDFNTERLKISELKPEDESEGRVFACSWCDIKAFRFDFTPSNFTVLDIFTEGGINKKFVFLDNKTEDQSIQEESVFSIFRNFVILFNKSNDGHKKISLLPGFLTTSIGTLFLFLPGIFIITALFLRLKYANFYYLGFLVFGIATFIPLIVRRGSQKKLYARLSAIFRE